MLFLSIISLLAGLILLVKGADWLVDGGVGIAKKMGISELVIGLTIVSFGTSTPELLVNIIASAQGSADLAISNIVGSNLANTLLIIGVTAAIMPLTVQRSTVFKEIPFCILASLTLFIAANDTILDGRAVASLDRTDGLTFLGFFIIFLYYTFGIRHQKNGEVSTSGSFMPQILAIVYIIGGSIALALGGHFTVQAAVDIASRLGVNESLIGFTLVAIGTSLPELVTSVNAALKKNADIAVGNVIGSNIFNIFWILGLSATIRPLVFQPYLNVDLLIVLCSTLIIFLFVHTGHLRSNWLKALFSKPKREHFISQREGWLLLAMYFAYMVYLGWRG